MNIALICDNVIRVSQVVGDFYAAQGHIVYHILFTHRRQLDYSVNVNTKVVYVDSDEEIDNTDLFSFVDTANELANRLRKIKREYRIDTSISFMEKYNALNVLSKINERCIISVRTTLSPRTELNGYEYNKTLLRILYNLSDLVITAGEYSKEDLIKNYHIQRKKVKAIPNPAIRHSYLEEREWKYGNKAILSITRFDSVKQIDRLIRAFSYAYHADSNVNLLLIGDGEERPYLERLASNLGIRKAVFFLGHTDDVGYYLHNSKMFVMSSRVEGFPNAMVEAMSYGKPVISTETPGGCREIIGKCNRKIDGIQYCKYGIMTPYMSDRAKKGDFKITYEEKILGAAMLKIIDNDEIYNHYANQSLKRASDYNYEYVMKMWGDVLGNEATQ